MKKILVLLLAVLPLLLVGCKKEYSDLILGTWDIDCSQSVYHEELTNSLGHQVDEYPVSRIGLQAASYAFFDNGLAVLSTTYAGEGSFADTLSYSLNGDSLSFGASEWYRLIELSRDNMVIETSSTQTTPDEEYSFWIRFVMKRRN